MEILNEKEYEKFVSSHKKSHFMQSYYWGEVSTKKNFIPHYVGIKEKGKIVAATLMLQKKLPKGYSYFYCPRGFVIDFENVSLLKKFTKEIKEYAKSKKAIYIKIDPDIKRHDMDSDGNIIGNDSKITDILKNQGYIHKGYNVEFTNEQPRFTFRLDLTKSDEEIFSGMHSTTRKILNKENKFEIYKGTIKDIDEFYITMEETAAREHLGCNKIEYYENFYNVLNKNNMSDLYVLKLNVTELKDRYNNKIIELEDKIVEMEKNTKVNLKKQQNKINEINTEINKIKKDLIEINEIKEEKLTLSSIMTARYGNKVWTVHGGNITALRNLNANYFLYYEIIKDAKKEKYEIIDFFGCSGVANPPKESSIAGLHNFKKRLGGEYTEFLGEFDLIINKPLYHIFNILIPIRRKLVKRKKVKESEKK